jgi:hypothetical protein
MALVRSMKSVAGIFPVSPGSYRMAVVLLISLTGQGSAGIFLAASHSSLGGIEWNYGKPGINRTGQETSTG